MVISGYTHIDLNGLFDRRGYLALYLQMMTFLITNICKIYSNL